MPKPTKPKGRHPHHRLTAVRVRHAKPGRYFDGNGLMLFVEQSGSKRWVSRVVVVDKETGRAKRCDLGLGSVDLVALADARTAAADLRRLARAGEDIVAARKTAKKVVPTFERAATDFHKEHSAPFRNAQHRKVWLASLKSDVFPTFGTKPVSAVTVADVHAVLSPIWLKKPETARRVKQRIHAVLAWAKAKGYRTGDDPTQGIERVLPRVRQAAVHHKALPYAAAPAFILTLQEDTTAGASAKLAFEFLILTAARTNEVIGARWNEIDHDARTWTIPAGRIKAHREHRVPLSPRCMELLEQAGKLGGDPFIFPGRTPKVPASNMVFLMLLRRLGVTDLTVHGFRSTFRDWCAEKTNAPRHVVEQALAHVVENKVEAAYLRTDVFERRRRLMNSWAQYATTKPASVSVIG